MVLSAVGIVLSIFIMIGVGMLLNHLGWLRDEHAEVISRLVVSVGLPAMIVSNIFTQFSREDLLSSAVGILIPVVSIAVTALAGLIAARAFRIPKARRGVFVCMVAFSNSVFIGVPVSLALFGEKAMPYALMYYIANTTLFWSWGYALMRADSGQKAQMNVKKLLPLPLTTFLVSIALVLLGLTLPAFILDAAKYIGNLVTPLSMIFTGIILMRMLKSGKVRWQKGYSLVLVGRFLIAPALLILTARIFPTAPELMRNVLLIQAAMPVMSQTPIVAKATGGDEEYAAGGVALTALFSLLAIPAYMALVPYL
jgi:malate permease and related proteins